MNKRRTSQAKPQLPSLGLSAEQCAVLRQALDRRMEAGLKLIFGGDLGLLWGEYLRFLYWEAIAERYGMPRIQLASRRRAVVLRLSQILRHWPVADEVLAALALPPANDELHAVITHDLERLRKPQIRRRNRYEVVMDWASRVRRRTRAKREENGGSS